MDKMSRILDEKYMSIPALNKKAEFHAQIAKELSVGESTAAAVQKQVEKHEQSAHDLRMEAIKAMEDMVDDFMVVDDVTVLSVLKYRYMDGMTWEEIASKVNKTARRVMQLRDQGLQTILQK